ncbi:hypothetical protein E4U09_005574 [Claviceps aff. purpurea]|uniref:Uncharacterized protein n=1 Tax=Claviceps aff. purpurea TaxID=1967640 RepID=A0A9P7TZ10_9HYPO|nr:hypothetical protein E4U09_005574 [Claviceps aff. purpurea]
MGSGIVGIAGQRIPVAFARAVEEDNGAEDRLAQRRSAEIEAVELMRMEEVKRAILRRSEALSPRQTQQLSPVVAPRPPSFPRFLVHTQQARPASGTDIQPPLAHRHLRQLPPKVTESRIPSTSEKKSLHVLRVPPLQYCPVPTQPQPVPQGKLVPPQLLHETPMPTPRTEIRPGILTAPVDKAVTNLANEILTKPRHGTPGEAEEEHFPYFSDSLKSAAVCPCDELEQGRDQALDKRAPADEEEPSHDEILPIVKKTLRGEFAPATYMLSPVQGSFWSPPAPKLLTNTVTLVGHLFTDFENYFRLVERLVP